MYSVYNPIHLVNSNSHSSSSLNYFKTNIDKVKEELNQENWNYLDTKDCEGAWNAFASKLTYIVNKHSPKSHNRKNNKIIYNKETATALNKKNKAFKRYKSCGSTYNWNQYKNARKKLKQALRKNKATYEINVAKNIKTNPKKFWKFVNNKLKKKDKLGPLIGPDQEVIDTDEEKANLLNKFFASVFTYENEILPNKPIMQTDKKLCEFTISQEEVKKKLSEIDPNKSMGPDNLHPHILKQLHKVIAEPLSLIFNKSIKEGVVPVDWKHAVVTAIYKKGNKTDPGNYRPVSLTSVICKILEKIIKDKMTKFLEENNLLSDLQYGFRQKRSCVTQLLSVLNKITKYIEDGETLDMIYLDFKKAFDSVPHKRLLLKLESYGIRGKLLTWIDSFLSNRKQKVKVGEELSEEVDVLSGIPQGSVLGPLLFVLFINDLPNNIKSECFMFADDTKLFNSTNNNQTLQEDIRELEKWSATWQLQFNALKCKVLHIGKNNPKLKYTFQNIQLIETET